MSMFSDYPVWRTVPNFVGLAYEDAKRLERTVGVHTADPNPDAAPIANFWWEHQEMVVVSQAPAPGARINREQSVTITLGPPEVPVGAVVSHPTPPTLKAQADADADADAAPRARTDPN